MIVVEGPRSVAGDRWIDSLGSNCRGVVSVVPRPGSKALWALTYSVLASFGQEEAALGSTQRDGDVLEAWVAAHGVTDVILSHADHFSVEVLSQLHAHLDEVQVDLWLVVEPTFRDYLVSELQANTDVVDCTWSSFQRVWASRAYEHHRELTGTSSSSTRPKRSARPEARADLAAPTVAYLIGFSRIADAAASLTAQRGGSRGSAQGPHKVRARVASLLRRLADDLQDPVCFARAVDGAGVYLGTLGWPVSQGRVPGFASSRGEILEGSRVANLRRFRDPETGSAAALACVGVAIDEIAGLQMGHVADDGSSIMLGRDQVVLPELLRPVVRAQLIMRRRGKATSGDRFLSGPSGTLTPRRVALLIQVGLGLERGSAEWRRVLAAPSADERWLNGQGVWIGPYSRAPGRRRIEGSGDRFRDAVKCLRNPDRVSNPRCSCETPHKAYKAPPPPERRTLGHPVAMSHPWRRQWPSSNLRAQRAGSTPG